ncbi:phage tail tape measure protein [Mesorhizobium opportunistum]|uniref:phage tail tape measure protein n=1 Tax=Mesorhizobium opportunistum TaxID=593909 RepID=UPI00333DCC7E
MATTIKQRIELDGGKELKRELQEFGAAGEKAFRELQKAAAATKGLSPGFFNSLKQAEVQIKALGVQFVKTGKQIQDVGRTLTTSLTLPIVGVGAGILKVSGDFQKAMNSFAVNAGVAGAALEDAEGKAKELGVASVFSTTEAAQGMTELAKVGLDFQTIMGGAAKAMVDLAAANDTGLAASAGVIGDVINQFKLSVSQLPGIVDQITGATIQSKLSFQDYALAIGQAGGAAGALGVNFEEFNAVLAATAPLFTSGSDAGTSFKTFLTRLVPQSKQAAAMMQKLGLRFFDAKGNMISMADAAQLLQDKLGNLSDEDRNDAVSTIFGTDALRTALALMKLGSKGVDDMMAHLKNTDSADIAATRVKGFNGEVNKLVEALSNLGIEIGKSGFLDFATNIVIKLTEWTTALATVSPEMLRFGTIIGGTVASIGPLLFGLGLATRAFGVTLQGLGTLIAGFRNLGAALLFVAGVPELAALVLIGGAIAVWAARTDAATAALEKHKAVVDEVDAAYQKAGGSLAKMTQEVRERLSLETSDALEKDTAAFNEALANLVNKLPHFEGDLGNVAANAMFAVSKALQEGKISVEQFNTEITKIGAANLGNDVGKLATAWLGMSKETTGASARVGEMADKLAFVTGKMSGAEYAAAQAARGIAGFGDASVAAGAKADAAVDNTAKKVGNLDHQINVFRGGGAGGKLSKEVFDVVDGVAHRAEEGKKALDGLKSSVDSTGGAVDGVSNEITNSISTIAPAAQQAADGFTSALGNLDAGAAQQAAEAIVAPFETLPGKFSAILNGIRAMLQGGFSGLQGIVTSLASQIESAINRILASLRAAADAAQRLRAAAAGSGSSDSGGSHGGFAGGGYLANGPGSSTSDSIPIWASVREFVMQAKATAYYGPGFMHALNQMKIPREFFHSMRGFNIGGLVDHFNRSMSIPRMAGGGMVPALSSSGNATGNKRTPIILQLPGGEQIDDLTIGDIALTRLQQHLQREATTSLGRRPGRR